MSDKVTAIFCRDLDHAWWIGLLLTVAYRRRLRLGSDFKSSADVTASLRPLGECKAAQGLELFCHCT